MQCIGGPWPPDGGRIDEQEVKITDPYSDHRPIVRSVEERCSRIADQQPMQVDCFIHKVICWRWKAEAGPDAGNWHVTDGVIDCGSPDRCRDCGWANVGHKLTLAEPSLREGDAELCPVVIILTCGLNTPHASGHSPILCTQMGSRCRHATCAGLLFHVGESSAFSAEPYRDCLSFLESLFQAVQC